MGNRDVGEQLDSCVAYSKRLEEAAEKILAELDRNSNYCECSGFLAVDFIEDTLNDALAGRGAK